MVVAKKKNGRDHERQTQTPMQLNKRTGKPKTGKSSNPEYASSIFIIKKSTKKKAMRILNEMDESDPKKMDMSDLVESLLQEWLARQ
jgi:hypothetical protein